MPFGARVLREPRGADVLMRALAIFFCGLLVAAPAPAEQAPLVLAPHVGGLLMCQEGADNPAILDADTAYAYCRQQQLDQGDSLVRLLNELEPGGPAGQVQVGYVLNIPLLGLYAKTASGEWEIDSAQLQRLLQLVVDIPRPVVIYLAANHFDTLGPITDSLQADPANLMQLRGGKPLQLDYFGYRVVPYTLLTDPDIAVNRYRFAALQRVARELERLPQEARQRIVAITLAGELHQLFPDFESGMAAYQDIRVTDYSPASVAGFRDWLRQKYGSVDELNRRGNFTFRDFEAVPAPARDIRKEPLQSFAEHYDAWAAGSFPITGWLWDPGQRVEALELYVDGERVGSVERGFNRLDVYRAVEEVDDPNTGFRYDLDYRRLAPGWHVLQVLATLDGKLQELGRAEFVVMGRDQASPGRRRPVGMRHLGLLPQLPALRYWLDMPASGQVLDLYHNPLARDWDLYRQWQVYHFLDHFYRLALLAELPVDKLYSHQLVPQANSSWNPQLFAAGSTLDGDAPWRQGLDLYGGATDGAWLRRFLRVRGMGPGYGVPEFNPQQWKGGKAVHLQALQAHLEAGARFVSPYYFSVIPDRFKGSVEHGVNRMELRPDNEADGSDLFYQAIIEFARQ